MAEAVLRMNDTMIPRPDLSVELRERMEGVGGREGDGDGWAGRS